MKRWVFFAAMLLLVTFPAFAVAQRKAITDDAGAASARKAIEALNWKETDACQKMDNAESASLWADDGVDLIQGLPPMVGKAKISAWYKTLAPQLRGPKVESCTIEWRETRIQDKWAWEWGISRQKVDFPPPRKPFESVGKILLILKQQADGTWKIELES